MDIEIALCGEFAIPTARYEHTDQRMRFSEYIQGSMVKDYIMRIDINCDLIGHHHRLKCQINYSEYIMSVLTIYGLDKIFTMARVCTIGEHLWVIYSIGYFAKSNDDVDVLRNIRHNTEAPLYYVEKFRQVKRFSLHDTDVVNHISEMRELIKLVTDSYYHYDLLSMDDFKRIRKYF